MDITAGESNSDAPKTTGCCELAILTSRICVICGLCLVALCGWRGCIYPDLNPEDRWGIHLSCSMEFGLSAEDFNAVGIVLFG